MPPSTPVQASPTLPGRSASPLPAVSAAGVSTPNMVNRRGSLMNVLERTSSTLRKKLNDKRRSQEIVSGPFHVAHVSHGGPGATEDAVVQAMANSSRSSDSTPSSHSSDSLSLSGEMAVSLDMETAQTRSRSNSFKKVRFPVCSPRSSPHA